MTPRLGVAVLVTDAEGRLLLGRRSKQPNYGLWVIPGGGVKFGEPWQAAARRELCEETGLQISVAPDQRPYVIDIISEGEHRVILYVTGSVEGGILKASSDLLEARFFRRGALPVELSPAMRPVLVEFGWVSGFMGGVG